MVNDGVTGPRAAERALVLRYAREPARAGLAALLALDDRLGAIVRRGGDPALAQMRLTWWLEALERLDAAPAPAEPLLRALAAEVLPAGVGGAELAELIDGWEPLLFDEPPNLEAMARSRGARSFVLAGRVLGLTDDRLATMGEGWALADLAVAWGKAEARGPALAHLDAAFGAAWPRALRPLGALGLLARSDLRGDSPGAPGRVGRLFVHRLTGR